MMVKGSVTNNTGRSRHIFKRTIYPGQSVSLDDVYLVLGGKIPKGTSFVEWLTQYLPNGWEITVTQPEKIETAGGRGYVETLTAVPEVEQVVTSDTRAYQENNEGNEDTIDHRSLEYATPRSIGKLNARDISNLRIKDNPKRILKNINSVHKLRRALTFCKNNSRKTGLARLIQRRIRELSITL